jgi:citrate/tricarballylate utilization protein
VPPDAELVAEAERQLRVCNACRYCEGYCAVFPALELRRDVGQADVLYLANLCFDCRDCLYACQYAPPHDFAINVPKLLAEVRLQTYQRYSWPGLLAGLLERNLRAVSLAVLSCCLVILALLAVIGDPGRLVTAQLGPGAFYVVAPYAALVIVALVLAGYGVVVFARGARRFWRETAAAPGARLDLAALALAVWDAFALTYLRGGGVGCQYPDERYSSARRWLHGLVFYGFLADLASTTLAAIYQDVLGIMPPFALLSAPVVLGTAGGVALLVGVAGLLVLKARSAPEANAAGMIDLDVAFLGLLGLTAASGLVLLALREAPVMGLLLALHLGCVAALFLVAPYGKFAHAVYRFAALVRHRSES